jgi:hypothetical protein
MSQGLRIAHESGSQGPADRSADTLPDDLSSLNFFLTIWANLQNT